MSVDDNRRRLLSTSSAILVTTIEVDSDLGQRIVDAGGVTVLDVRVNTIYILETEVMIAFDDTSTDSYSTSVAIESIVYDTDTETDDDKEDTTSTYATIDDKDSDTGDSFTFVTETGATKENLLTVSILLIVLCAVLLLCSGFSYSFCSRADDFKYIAVILFSIYMWDFFSDIFFAIDVYWTHIKGGDVETPFLIVFICSLVFIILPLLKNFYDLIKSQGEWQKSPLHGDRYRSWLDQYANILFFMSFLCGSTFGAIALVNSNLFGMRIFCMGLSTKDLRRFNQKRLVNVCTMHVCILYVLMFVCIYL